MNETPALLTDIGTLRRQITERLAAQQAELQGLTRADNPLDQLEDALAGLKAAKPWQDERQTLVDKLEELTQAQTVAEAGWQRAEHLAGQVRDGLRAQLEEARVLLAQTQHHLDERSWALGADEAESLAERRRLAGAFAATQKELREMQAQQQAQERQRVDLHSHVARLERDLQSVRGETLAEERDASRRGVAVAERVHEERRLVEAANRGLESRLSELAALQAEQEELSHERAALLDRMTMLERASEVRVTPSNAEQESWNLQRGQVTVQLAQLQQSLQRATEDAETERAGLLAELNNVRQQLSQVARPQEGWQQLVDDRAKLQARVQDLEQHWMAREAAVAQERALWQRYADGLTAAEPLLDERASPPAPIAAATSSVRIAPETPRDGA
ncbi:MAG: hypothetical protein E6I88_14425, partial [Chloroflexi bacterium]